MISGILFWGAERRELQPPISFPPAYFLPAAGVCGSRPAAGLMLLYLFITVYVYAIQARFVNTVFKTIINAFMMAVRHLPSTVLMIILNSVFFYIMFHYASWLGFWVLSGPVYLNSLLLSRIFKRYMRTDAKEITETDKNTAE